MTLISECLFSTKESTNSGSKYFKPPSQKQMVSPSCFDTSCYEKFEKVLMVKTSENDFQTQQHTCIGTFKNPRGHFRKLSSHMVFYPSFRHQLPVGGGIRVLWKHFFQLFNFMRHSIRLSCLSFKTAKCWIYQTSPLNWLCLSHIIFNTVE